MHTTVSVWYEYVYRVVSKLSDIRNVRKIAKKKTAISFIIYVCPTTRLSFSMEQLDSHWTDFREIWYLRIFRKFTKKNQVLLNFDKNNGQFTWRPMHIYGNECFLEWEIIQKKTIEKTKYPFYA